MHCESCWLRTLVSCNLSRPMGKPTICICENKDADQLRGYCEADQRLCFHYRDSTIPLLSTYKISSFWPSPVTVQAALFRTCLETTLLVFPCIGFSMRQLKLLTIHVLQYSIHSVLLLVNNCWYLTGVACRVLLHKLKLSLNLKLPLNSRTFKVHPELH